MPRITTEQRNSLASAFQTCRTWRLEGRIYIGECDGWHFWIGYDEASKQGVAAAVNLDQNIQVELPSRVATAWHAAMLTKLSS